MALPEYDPEPIVLCGILAGMIVPAHAHLDCSSYGGPCSGGQTGQLLSGRPITQPGSSRVNSMIMHDLHNMTAAGGSDIAVPSFTNRTVRGRYVYPGRSDVAHSINAFVSITPSTSTGNTITVADNLRAPPAIAAAVGYSQNTLSTLAFAASNVDVGGTFAPGFQWYLFNFFRSSPTPANIAINSNGSIAVGQGGNNYNATISSAAQTRGSPGFVGTAFGGGAYIEAVIRFNAQSFAITNGFPAFWANALESNLSATQWPGQAIGYGHAIEADILEYYQGGFSNPPNQYSASLIEWYGSGKKYGVGTAHTVPQAELFELLQYRSHALGAGNRRNRWLCKLLLERQSGPLSTLHAVDECSSTAPVGQHTMGVRDHRSAASGD